MTIGLDLDNTICFTNLKQIVELDELKKKNKKKWIKIVEEIFASTIPILPKELINNSIIITARDKDFERLTKYWIKFYYGDIKFKLFCVNYDKDTKIRKLNIIKNENIKLYIDDNKKWLEFINKALGNKIKTYLADWAGGEIK
ncbi:MAG: hypothetical protein ACTSWR_07890 [Candidatus Helarchaeota archaeon]